MNNNENFGPFKGKLDWIVFDRETNEHIRFGECENIVVNQGKNALCSSMVGGSPFVFTLMKVGTDNNPFIATDTDIGNSVSTDTSPNNSSVDNVMTVEGTFVFDNTYTIEEAGLFSGSNCWALTNSISETVNTVQGLLVIWTITLT
jgi:hypothetical protein